MMTSDVEYMQEVAEMSDLEWIRTLRGRRMLTAVLGCYSWEEEEEEDDELKHQPLEKWLTSSYEPGYVKVRKRNKIIMERRRNAVRLVEPKTPSRIPRKNRQKNMVKKSHVATPVKTKVEKKTSKTCNKPATNVEEHNTLDEAGTETNTIDDEHELFLKNVDDCIISFHSATLQSKLAAMKINYTASIEDEVVIDQEILTHKMHLRPRTKTDEKRNETVSKQTASNLQLVRQTDTAQLKPKNCKKSVGKKSQNNKNSKKLDSEANTSTSNICWDEENLTKPIEKREITAAKKNNEEHLKHKQKEQEIEWIQSYVAFVNSHSESQVVTREEYITSSDEDKIQPLESMEYIVACSDDEHMELLFGNEINQAMTEEMSIQTLHTNTPVKSPAIRIKSSNIHESDSLLVEDQVNVEYIVPCLDDENMEVLFENEINQAVTEEINTELLKETPVNQAKVAVKSPVIKLKRRSNQEIVLDSSLVTENNEKLESLECIVACPDDEPTELLFGNEINQLKEEINNETPPLQINTPAKSPVIKIKRRSNIKQETSIMSNSKLVEDNNKQFNNVEYIFPCLGGENVEPQFENKISKEVTEEDNEKLIKNRLTLRVTSPSVKNKRSSNTQESDSVLVEKNEKIKNVEYILPCSDDENVKLLFGNDNNQAVSEEINIQLMNESPVLQAKVKSPVIKIKRRSNFKRDSYSEFDFEHKELPLPTNMQQEQFCHNSTAQSPHIVDQEDFNRNTIRMPVTIEQELTSVHLNLQELFLKKNLPTSSSTSQQELLSPTIKQYFPVSDTEELQEINENFKKQIYILPLKKQNRSYIETIMSPCTTQNTPTPENSVSGLLALESSITIQESPIPMPPNSPVADLSITTESPVFLQPLVNNAVKKLDFNASTVTEEIKLMTFQSENSTFECIIPRSSLIQFSNMSGENIKLRITVNNNGPNKLQLPQIVFNEDLQPEPENTTEETEVLKRSVTRDNLDMIHIENNLNEVLRF